MILFPRLARVSALGTLAAALGALAAHAANPEGADKPAARWRRELVPVIGRPVSFSVSKRVRDLPARPARRVDRTKAFREVRNPSLAPRAQKSPIKPMETTSRSGDAALFAPATAPAAMPPPLRSFEGLSNADNGNLLGGYVLPPDTNGDIGPHHYVQTVNLVMRVHDRSGTPLTPPFLMSELFASEGEPCGTYDDGDPIVVYDHLADRWLVSQFALVTVSGPFYQCIAISQTGDPTGAYFAYTFRMPARKINDYPKFGVWPDAYYMTDNQFEFIPPSIEFTGTGVFAFDRTKMLAGDPSAAYIYFDLGPSEPNLGGMLPSDLDGLPQNRPNVFAAFTADEAGDPQGDGLRLFEFVPDFATPERSTFTELPFLPVVAFDPVSPVPRDDIPQPGTHFRLDSITDRLMHRLQYRRFAAHESLVVSHTVDASGDASRPVFRAGVRYYELRRPLAEGAAWAVHEQATYAPDDGVHRWMPSAAMDNDGNLAVGFSVSDGVSTFPGIRYGGRLATDPPGGLFQGEATLQEGSLTQWYIPRWGDYSMLAVDPVDDCTFWFTSEYYSQSNLCIEDYQNICWRTRVGSFRFPGCTSPPPNGSLTGTVTDADTARPVAGALVRASGAYTALTDASGAYTIRLPPGLYAVTASKPGFESASVIGLTVASGGTTTADLALTPAPLLVFESRTFEDSLGNANGNVDRNECIGLHVTLRNAGSATAREIEVALTTATPGVTVTSGTAAYADIAPGAGGTNTARFQFETSPGFVPGTLIRFTAEIRTARGSFSESFTVPSGTIDPTPIVFNGAGPVLIPWVGVAEVPLAVSGLDAPLAKVRLATRITHNYDGDLRLSLVGPDGTAVLLSDRRGDSHDNFGADCPADDGDDTVFDDEAAVPISGGEAPFVGSFRPERPLAVFKGKIGSAANGTWTFRVEDLEEGGLGAIECVTLVLNEDLLVSGGGGCGPHLSVGQATVDPEAAVQARFDVTLTPPLPTPVTVRYATADVTAAAGADYAAASGTLTFLPGETVQTVAVPVLADSLDEIDETFHLKLSDATGASIAGRGTGTVVDDDPEPRLAIADVAQPEGHAGTGSFVFEVSLSAPSGKVVAVDFETENGTAAAHSDYRPAADRLRFAPGETVIPLAVQVLGDTVAEPDEAFRLKLARAANAAVAVGEAVGTIQNDDTSRFHAVTPCRLLDTRLTPPPLAANADRDFGLTGPPCGVPADAAALAVNVTVVGQTAAGNLRIYPAGQVAPLASLINFVPGIPRANNAVLLLGPEGRVLVRCDMPGSTGSVHLVLDLYGYYR